MAVTKLTTGKWLVELYPNGATGRRIRRQFTTKGEALAYERHVKDQTEDKPWLGEKVDNRKLIDLVTTWYNAHGVTLKDGEKRKRAMEYADWAMGNPLAREFSASLFSAYREKRLSGKLSRSTRVAKVTPRTVNLELAYFRAMFNELIRLDEWNAPHPLQKVRAYKTSEQEMAYLTKEDMQRLFIECENSRAKDLLTVVKVCLATGARWTEAESLTGSQVSNRRITFTKTKGKKNRTVPISEQMFDALPKVKRNESLFTPCYSAFRSALKRADIEPPAGQCSHILRHTFGSHFMMSGGNILVLQRILGHTDIKVTMRYAHFAPDHLNDAITFNPLNLVESGDEMAIEKTNI